MDVWLDRAAARRGFEAAYGSDVLAREVEGRLAERLQYIKLDAKHILDVGCGAGASRIPLHARFPDAELYGVDFSLPALKHAQAPAGFMARMRGILQAPRTHWVGADGAQLPFASGSCDLVWSNLSLAWAADPAAWIREWGRVLRVDGLLMFTTYGPDTLKELRAAFGDDLPHVHPFLDMHDIGDMLAGNGFAEPVMDMEILTLTYADVPAMLADLRATGQTNAHQGRRKGLSGKARWESMEARYAALARDGRIPATFEVVYGHAWKGRPRLAADGRQIIEFRVRGTPSS